MRLIQLGNTEILISPQGLGCMGMSEFYGQIDDENSKKVVLNAIDLGVTFFDTADAYAFGRNEELIGGIIKAHPKRGDLVLATKCGIIRDEFDPSKRGVDNSAAYILACCEKSA